MSHILFTQTGSADGRAAELTVGSFAGPGGIPHLQFTLEAPYVQLGLVQVEQLVDVAAKWCREQRTPQRGKRP